MSDTQGWSTFDGLSERLRKAKAALETHEAMCARVRLKHLERIHKAEEELETRRKQLLREAKL
jgi:hypothetical protein